MRSSSRVVANTLVQYLRTVISVIITLYTSRIVLANLGVDDFGIYSLIGGVVSMLAFIQTNLANTTQRFLSYYRGRGEIEGVIGIFNNSICTQLFIAVILCGLLAICSDAVFTYVVNISPDRLPAARIVYWLMIGSLFINLQSTPYLATLISRENIVYSSIVQIIDSVLKIPVAVSLVWISEDKLEWYSFMLFGIVILNFSLYYLYCTRHYKECGQFRFSSFDKKICKALFSFMGWNVYGTGCIVARTQGTAVLLNNFFGTAINAAYGIANQLSGQLSFVSTSLTTAINPQIIKSEGAGNRQRMFWLAEISCKYAFLLFSIISIPAVIYMPTILELWLKNVPEHTVMFCIFMVISAQIDLSTSNLNTANQAIGNVKPYNLWINTIKALTIVAVFFVLWCGLSPTAAMIGYVSVEALCSIARLLFFRAQYSISIRAYIRNVFLKVLPTMVVNAAVCLYVSQYLPGLLFLVTGCISIIVTSSVTYLFGLKQEERTILVGLYKSLRNKLK